MFVSCHPVLSVPARTALTLRLIGGLTVPEIARAYVVPEPTIAQRIVRAKRTIAEAGVAFEVPQGADRTPRLVSVLQVDLSDLQRGVFGHGRGGLAATRALRRVPPARPGALRSGPGGSGGHWASCALLEFQSSRLRARTGPSGTPVLLLDQDRRTWDRLHIIRGEEALAHAERLMVPRGPYTLQAAIAACHARAFRPEDTDWDQVVSLYGELARTAPSPIVELNRAVAVSMASGPESALQLVDQLVETGTLERYHLLPSVRGDLLDRLGRYEEAALEFDRAAELATNAQERRLSRERARACRASVGSRRHRPSAVRPGRAET